MPRAECTPEQPCTHADRCESCARDLALVSSYGDPYAAIAGGFHIEPTRYPDFDGADAVELWYGTALLDTVKRLTDGTGWYFRGLIFASRDAAVAACRAEWQALVDVNLAEGREPLWRPAVIQGRAS